MARAVGHVGAGQQRLALGRCRAVLHDVGGWRHGEEFKHGSTVFASGSTWKAQRDMWSKACRLWSNDWAGRGLKPRFALLRGFGGRGLIFRHLKFQTRGSANPRSEAFGLAALFDTRNRENPHSLENEVPGDSPRHLGAPF